MSYAFIVCSGNQRKKVTNDFTMKLLINIRKNPIEVFQRRKPIINSINCSSFKNQSFSFLCL